jgi:dTDP-4-amino-4,6-dideoxygalactose transaminase
MMAGWTTRRRVLAAGYRRALASAPVTVPPECDPGHVYHLFPVLSPARDALQAHLERAGIGTLVHYPTALTEQPAFAAYTADCPVAVRVAHEVCSLPLHPHLGDADASTVAAAVSGFAPDR